MKKTKTKLTGICIAISIATMLTTPAVASPLGTQVNYEIKNILGLSQTFDLFTIDTTNYVITAANLSFSSLSNISNNLPITSIIFDSGMINPTHDILTFSSTANSQVTLLITLANNIHLGSQSSTNPLYEYVIQSAVLTEVIPDGKSKQTRSISTDLVETTGHGKNVSTKSYIQDPVTVTIPEPSTLALFAFALIGFYISHRKKESIKRNSIQTALHKKQ